MEPVSRWILGLWQGILFLCEKFYIFSIRIKDLRLYIYFHKLNQSEYYLFIY